MVVCYGHPKDPEAFDAHYRATHIPLARRIPPGLSGYTWGKCSALDGGSPPAYYSIASLCFPPDAETMHAGLASKEMREAGRDVRNFATGGVTMFTQEVEPLHCPTGEA